MRIAVTGREGQVVQALRAIAAPRETTIIPIARPELDLARDEPLIHLFKIAKPDVVVSAAAYTAVDRAESEEAVAFAVNAHGARRVAEAAAALDVPLVHLSTDYVFDGLKQGPWIETDPTHPLSIYGASKLAGERAIAEATADFAILRVAWVYSPYGTNFVKTMLRLGETRDVLKIVGDQTGAPTSAFDIAEGILRVAANLKAGPRDQNLRGIFHMGAGGATTWAGFARAIFEGWKTRCGRSVDVVPITTEEYPTAARRPKNSVLNSAKLSRAHGVALPQWDRSLDQVLDMLTSSQEKEKGS